MNETTIKCSGCKHLEIVSGGGWCHAIYSCSGENYAEREESKIEQKNMSDKIQMTEEQIDIFITNCVTPDLRPYVKNQAIKHGYILKSDLQQKVEEAEEMYEKVASSLPGQLQVSYLLEVIDKHKAAIIVMKQSHPEFKK